MCHLNNNKRNAYVNDCNLDKSREKNDVRNLEQWGKKVSGNDFSLYVNQL